MASIDFIGIGAQRSGTTWLDKRLRELPDFTLLPAKEIHYFDRSPIYPTYSDLAITQLRKRIRGLSWPRRAARTILRAYREEGQQAASWYARFFFANYTDDWYLRLFAGFEGITGEITPSYSILQLKDIRRMYKLAPHAKIIFLVRNPVHRAWSHFRFYRARQVSPDWPPEQIDRAIRFMNSEGQQLRSDYLRTIKSYSKVFPPERLLIGFYDAIDDQPQQLLEEIVSFLGGDPGTVQTHCKIRERNNMALSVQMPKRVEDYLKNKYRPMIEAMAEQYGSYCIRWYEELYGQATLPGKAKSPLATVAACSPPSINKGKVEGVISRNPSARNPGR